MSARDRIEYAISIKHWCEANPYASDDALVEFLERIEKKVAETMSRSEDIKERYYANLR